MADRRILVLNWLTQLRHLTRATSEAVTRDKLASYATVLLTDFRDDTFTRESLNAVVAANEFFPAYASLKATLEAFHGTRRKTWQQPATEALPQWLEDRIIENCGGQPGPLLAAWLEGKRMLREAPPLPEWVTQ